MKASWAKSSARPTSWTSLARPAMILADSIRQTASIVRFASGAVTDPDHTTVRPRGQAERARALLVV